MSNLPIFDVAGSALHAQSVRLSTLASNMANANSVAGSPDEVYKPLEPVFRAVASQTDPALTGVEVGAVVERNTPPVQRYEPGHPLADEQGYVYAPDVDPVSQMVNMISASRSYQNNVEVMNTTQQLLAKTLQLGQ